MSIDADAHRSSAVPDWEALEGSSEFRELRSARRKVLGPLMAITAGSLAVYTLLLITTGDGALGDRALGLTWGIWLVVVMTVLIFLMALLYSRASLNTLDPLVERTVALAQRGPATPPRNGHNRPDGSHDDQTGARAGKESAR